MADNSIGLRIRKVVCEQLGVSEEELDNLDPLDDRISEEVICEQLENVSEEELVVLDHVRLWRYGIEISDEDVRKTSDGPRYYRVYRQGQKLLIQFG